MTSSWGTSWATSWGNSWGMLESVLYYIKVGTYTPVNFYIGDTQVSRIYLGEALVYSS